MKLYVYLYTQKEREERERKGERVGERERIMYVTFFSLYNRK